MLQGDAPHEARLFRCAPSVGRDRGAAGKLRRSGSVAGPSAADQPAIGRGALQPWQRADGAGSIRRGAGELRPGAGAPAGHAETLYNRGGVLKALKRYDDALASYDRALAIKPKFAEALNNRGGVLRDLERYDEALASFDRALAINPHFVDALQNRGAALVATWGGTRRRSRTSSERWLSIPICRRRRERCSIRECTSATGGTTFRIRRGSSPMCEPGNPARPRLRCWRFRIPRRISCVAPDVGARAIFRRRPPASGRASGTATTGSAWRTCRRISTSMPMAYLMAGLFERHDRSRFETIAVSLGPDTARRDALPAQRRLRALRRCPAAKRRRGGAADAGAGDRHRGGPERIYHRLPHRESLRCVRRRFR